MNRLRIGIIGMGRMGITHYSIINTHPLVDITALSDTSGIMLSLMGKYLPEVKMFTDYRELLNSQLVDAVIVCTPSFLHYPICLLAFEKGISVFCEKPFTTNAELAADLARKFEMKGLVNQVGYVYRFDPVFKTVRKLVNDGILGKVCHVSANFLSATITKTVIEKGWRAKRENGGGCVFEMGSHVFDLMEYIFGNPTRIVSTSTAKVYSENVEDICDVQCVYPGNVLAMIHVNWSDYTYRKPMLQIEIHGTKGKMMADLYGYKLFLREENVEAGIQGGWTQVPMNMIPDPAPFYVRGTSFTNQLYAFADAVIESRPTIGCNFQSAGNTQSLIGHIFENENNK